MEEATSLMPVLALHARMLGNAHQSKHQVMQEAVANHGPEVNFAATNAVSSCTSLATSVICCTINIVSIQLHRQSGTALTPSKCQSPPALGYSSSCYCAPALFINADQAQAVISLYQQAAQISP